VTTSEDQAQDLMDKIMGAGVDLNPPDAFLRGFGGLRAGTATRCPEGHTNVVAAGGRGTCFDCATAGKNPEYRVGL